MSPQNYPPDLNSILRTLSAFSNQSNTHNLKPPSNNIESIDNDNDYEPPGSHPPPVAQPQFHKQTRHRPPQSSPLPPQSFKGKHPSSTITSWPAALKQVIHTVSQNEEIQHRIRFLIQRQHNHEKQWWKGREVLLQKQKARKEKKKELDEVLRSVGAPVDEKDVSTAEEDVAEIQNYDAKVYKASSQMADAMLLELKALDVPFFNLKQSLIRINEAKKQKQRLEDRSSAGLTPDMQGQLSREDLTAFQQRMLELLQDLCRE
ncbi:hypothetical protein BJX70DRAFT_129493 [Aspergillus crustosus]